MGDSHFKSNIVGKNGTETITNFATIGDSSTALVGTTGAITTVTSTTTNTTYLKFGTHNFVMKSSYNTAASVLQAATAIDASIADSFVLGDGKMFYIQTNATCQEINATALT